MCNHVLYVCISQGRSKAGQPGICQSCQHTRHQYLTGVIGNIVIVSPVLHKRKQIPVKIIRNLDAVAQSPKYF